MNETYENSQNNKILVYHNEYIQVLRFKNTSVLFTNIIIKYCLELNQCDALYRATRQPKE